MINVLFINIACTNYDGATYSMLDLIKSVKNEVYPIVLLRSKGCVYDLLAQYGIECVICDFEDTICTNPVKFYQYIKYVLKFIPKFLRYHRKNTKCVNFLTDYFADRKIDIVHTNNSVLDFGCDIAMALKAKHVWHVRGFMDLDFGWMPFLGWRNMKNKVAESDAVIGITKVVLEHYLLQTNKRNAYAIFDAVRSKDDISNYYPKEKYFLFCAGFLSHRKGCDFAIKAFAQSKVAAQGYRLRVVGTCSEAYMTELKQMVSENGIEGVVDFIGSSKNVKEHMEKATAFLMCSENEGLGRVSIEAMFYGCLVLGRNSGGTKEFIFDGETGLLFDDVKQCADVIVKATQSDNKEIITRAQEFARSNFAIEDYGSKILSIYNKVLTNSSKIK